MAFSAATPLVDAPEWSHHWRKGGPMRLAKLTTRWPHAAGESYPPGGPVLLAGDT
jgi:hypothetical protein